MTTGESRPPHAVLMVQPDSYSAQAIAGVLGKRSGSPALDFVARVRRDWGFVAESMNAAEAESLAADLTKGGQACAAVPTSLLESSVEPVVVQKAEVGPEGFEIVAVRGLAPRERLAWNRLAVAAAGGIELLSAMRVPTDPAGQLARKAVRIGITLATGLPLGPGEAPKDRVVETRDRKLVLDLLFTGPSRRLRVETGDFDFSALGDKMGYTTEANFHALLGIVATRASACIRNRGFRALAGRGAPADVKYESLEDLEREERWLLTLAVLKPAPRTV